MTSPRILDVDDLDAVEWSSLRGAYGPSVGGNPTSAGGHRDIAAALRVLATERDPHSDLRSDANDIVLWSHGWHQGSVYPVTAAIVPFVISWIVRGRDVDGELAIGLENIATSTARDDDVGIRAAFAPWSEVVLGWRSSRRELVEILGATVFRDVWPRDDETVEHIAGDDRELPETDVPA